MSLQQLQLPVSSSATSPSPAAYCANTSIATFPPRSRRLPLDCDLRRANDGVLCFSLGSHYRRWHWKRRRSTGLVFAGGAEETEVLSGDEGTVAAADDAEEEPTPEDLEYVAQIKRVMELLRKNRDMLFGEIKLTILIEDPREVERRRLLGIDDSDAPSREDLVAALEDVNEGRVPKNRVALRMLAEEMINWPNLEEEAPKKKPKSRSPYARATDTGIDPKEAAKRLNMDWDTAAEFEEDTADESEVPSAVGYGALYLVTAFPVIIGISVVLILFYNSLQ